MASSLRLQTTVGGVLKKVRTNKISVTSSSPSIQQQQQLRWGHTVRLIALEDLPHGKGYEGDVIHVKAGYARNYLIPQKKALYAIPQNFDRLGIIDPDIKEEDQKEKEALKSGSLLDQELEEQYLKEADTLKHYLRNKVLKIWRVVDPNTTDVLFPGKVNKWNLRKKLSKQLNIDLEDHETLHIVSKDQIYHAALKDEQTMQRIIQNKVVELEEKEDDSCSIEIKRLGQYLAIIGLNGGHVVPLKFVVLQRMP